MATALGRVPGTSASLALVARERGTALGAGARERAAAPAMASHAASLDGLVNVLRDAGYEPRTEGDGTVCLGNCPYEALAASHRDVTCGMNLAWAEGVVGGLGLADIDIELAPEPGRCCVVFHATGMERSVGPTDS